MDQDQKDLAKVIEKYFGADAAYLDIDVFTLAKQIIEAGWRKPVRCKDCEHFFYSEYMSRHCCDLWGDGYDAPEDDDFCSYGKRCEKNEKNETVC